MIDDSEVLKILIENGDNVDPPIIDPIIKNAMDKLNMIYQNNFLLIKFENSRLIEIINAASYLNNNRLKELLIIYHHNRGDISLLNIDLQYEYEKLIFLDEVIHSFIANNVNTSFKYVPRWSSLNNHILLASKYGNLEMIEWYFKSFPSKLNIHNNYLFVDMFTIACEKNHLNIVEYCYDIIKYCNLNYLEYLNYLDIDDFLDIACINGSLEVAKYLFSFLKRFKYIENHCHKICQNGHLDMIIWIYSVVDVSWIIHNLNFDQACINGHLELTKWLFHNRFIIYTYDKIKSLFIISCFRCHLGTSKWLYTEIIHRYNYDIDIHFNNDELFRNSYRRGDIPMLKWLRSIRKKTIYNYMFKWCIGEQIKYPIYG